MVKVAHRRVALVITGTRMTTHPPLEAGKLVAAPAAMQATLPPTLALLATSMRRDLSLQAHPPVMSDRRCLKWRRTTS